MAQTDLIGPGQSIPRPGLVAKLTLLGLGLTSIVTNMSLAVAVLSAHWFAHTGPGILAPWPYVVPSWLAIPCSFALLITSVGAVYGILLEGQGIFHRRAVPNLLVVPLLLMSIGPGVVTKAPLLSAPLLYFLFIQAQRRAEPRKAHDAPWLHWGLLVILALPTISEAVVIASALTPSSGPGLVPTWLTGLPPHLGLASYLYLTAVVGLFTSPGSGGTLEPRHWIGRKLWLLVLLSLLQLPAYQAAMRPMLY